MINDDPLYSARMPNTIRYSMAMKSLALFPVSSKPKSSGQEPQSPPGMVSVL